MRTLGRVLAVLGLATAVIGSVGAVAMLPPPVLDDAGSYVEERRQALRRHLPDMPDLQGLVAGLPASDCVPAGSGDASQEQAACAAEDPPGDPTDLLTRSNEAALRFRAPAPAEAETPQE